MPYTTFSGLGSQCVMTFLTSLIAPCDIRTHISKEKRRSNPYLTLFEKNHRKNENIKPVSPSFVLVPPPVGVSRRQVVSLVPEEDYGFRSCPEYSSMFKTFDRVCRLVARLLSRSQTRQRRSYRELMELGF